MRYHYHLIVKNNDEKKILAYWVHGYVLNVPIIGFHPTSSEIYEIAY